MQFVIAENARTGYCVMFSLTISLNLHVALNSPDADETLQVLGHHIQAAQSQVALVMLLLIFLSTFAIEFRHFRFATVCIDTSLECPVSLSEDHSELSRWQPNQL